MSGLSIGVLLTVVVPQFTPLFESAGAQLPLLTRVVIAGGDAAQRYWWLLLLGLVACIWLVRRQFPHLKLVARARNRQHAFRLMDLGVDEPVRETFHSSLKMTRKTLEALGMPHEQAVDRVERFRRHDEKLLKTQYLVYDDETRLVQTSIEALSDLQKLLDADMAPEAAQERQSAAPVAAADPD